MVLSDEMLILLIQREIENVYGNPSAAGAEADRRLDHEGGGSTCTSAMYRIQRWTREGNYHPKRTTLIKLARGLGIISEDGTLLKSIPGMEPDASVNEELNAGDVELTVSGYIHSYRTAASLRAIDQVARTLKEVEDETLKVSADTAVKNFRKGGRRRHSDEEEAGNPQEKILLSADSGTETPAYGRKKDHQRPQESSAQEGENPEDKDREN